MITFKEFLNDPARVKSFDKLDNWAAVMKFLKEVPMLDRPCAFPLILFICEDQNIPCTVALDKEIGSIGITIGQELYLYNPAYILTDGAFKLLDWSSLYNFCLHWGKVISKNGESWVTPFYSFMKDRGLI